MNSKRQYFFVFISIIVFAFIVGYAFENNIIINQSVNNFELSLVQKDSSWTYVILLNKKVLINQSVIPAIPGNRPFKSKEQAEIIGKFVQNKLINNLPPYITEEEINTLLCL